MKQSFLAIVLLFIASLSFAQQDSTRFVSIVGRITDVNSGAILPGVKITNEKRNHADLSKSNGFYSIVAAEGDIIRFTHVGYEPLYMRVNEAADSKETIMITMKESENRIDSVLVDKPSLDELNDYFMALEVEEDADRALAEQNSDTFTILEEIEEPGPGGPVSFLSDVINNKIKKKMRKPGRKKALPKEK